MPDDTLDIPIPGEGNSEMDTEMTVPSAQFERLHDQNMAAMGQAMTQYQGDATKVSKAADYMFLQDKNLVSLAEAVGVREVSSRVTPAGPVPATAVSG